MAKKNGHLADGSLLMARTYDVEVNNNYYKKINNKWYIFGNLALYPILDEEKIIVLEIELTIEKSKGE